MQLLLNRVTVSLMHGTHALTSYTPLLSSSSHLPIEFMTQNLGALKPLRGSCLDKVLCGSCWDSLSSPSSPGAHVRQEKASRQRPRCLPPRIASSPAENRCHHPCQLTQHTLHRTVWGGVWGSLWLRRYIRLSLVEPPRQ